MRKHLRLLIAQCVVGTTVFTLASALANTFADFATLAGPIQALRLTRCPSFSSVRRRRVAPIQADSTISSLRNDHGSKSASQKMCGGLDDRVRLVKVDSLASSQFIVRRRRPIVIALEVLLCGSACGVAVLSAIHVFQGAPRAPVESATFLFVATALLLALARPSAAAAGYQGASSDTPWIWLGVSVLAAFCLYAPSLSLGFLSDDFVLLRLSREGAFVIRADWFFRPVPLLLWRAFQALRVPTPLFHSANVAFHGMNAFLVASVGVRLGMTRSAGVIAGALFLTFPAAPEAVAWLSGVHDVLLTSATLIAVLLAFGGSEGRNDVYVALAVLVALGCKETAVCLPLLMALAVWPVPVPRHHQPRAVFIAGLFVLAYVGVRLVYGLTAGYMQPLSRYLVKQLIVVSYGTLASPWRSNPVRTPMLEWASATLAVGLTCASALVAWQRRASSFERVVRLAPWVVIAVAPVFTYFTVSASLEGARYLYLPEAGWALLLASMFDDLIGRGRKPRVIVLAVALAMVGASVAAIERELAIWRRAAVVRDQVVGEARDALARERCSTARFVDAPDSVEGAYVFRNGLQDAVADVLTIMPVSNESCTLRWTGTRFVRLLR